MIRSLADRIFQPYGERGAHRRGAEQVEDEQSGEGVRHAQALLLRLLLQIARREHALVEPACAGTNLSSPRTFLKIARQS